MVLWDQYRISGVESLETFSLVSPFMQSLCEKQYDTQMLKLWQNVMENSLEFCFGFYFFPPTSGDYHAGLWHWYYLGWQQTFYSIVLSCWGVCCYFLCPCLYYYYYCYYYYLADGSVSKLLAGVRIWVRASEHMWKFWMCWQCQQWESRDGRISGSCWIGSLA